MTNDREIQYAIATIYEDGSSGFFYYVNSVEEGIEQMIRDEREHNNFTDRDYYKFVIIVPDSSSARLHFIPFDKEIRYAKIVYAPAYISFMKGWTYEHAKKWVREKYLKEHPPEPKPRIREPLFKLLKSNAKYEAVAVSYNGKYGIVTNGDTPDEAKKTWEKLAYGGIKDEKLDFVDLGKYVDYPYVLVIPAHKGSKENILKQRVIDADAIDADIDFKFMNGWTVERAIKKIVVENKKEEEKNPDEPLLWGLDSGL